MQLLIARKRNVEFLDAPDPVPAAHHVLIQPMYSAVSAGTELSVLTQGPPSVSKFIKKGLRGIQKVKKSLARRGFKQTLGKIESALVQEIPLGYSVAGRVVAVGSSVQGFTVGDYAIGVGPGANHGTLCSVPRLLCARLASADHLRDASCAALACVGIHAMHRAELNSQAEVAVFGLGAIGQFAVQALLAAGHRVVAFDPIESRRAASDSAGAETIDPTAYDFQNPGKISTLGTGFAAVFLCAKTESVEVMHQAAALCRKRGRLMIVGEIPIQLSREDAYEKELEIRVCAAYGEGRYDPAYEQYDQDYPASEGRWSVRRNLEFYAAWLEKGLMRPELLKPKVVGFSEAPSAYQLAGGGSLLTLLKYPEARVSQKLLTMASRAPAQPEAISIAVVGSGRFASETHLPNLRQASDKFDLHTLSGRTPSRVSAMARRHGARQATCDFQLMLKEKTISAVLLATPHGQHGEQVLSSIGSGKHTYVEKPLCIDLSQWKQIQAAVDKNTSLGMKPVLFVGFNRRFAPLSKKIAGQTRNQSTPLAIRYLFQAPPLPKGEWYDHPLHGGRFVGEACHAVDWILWLVGSPLKEKIIVAKPNDEWEIALKFANSSTAELHYKLVRELIGPKEVVDVQQGTTRWHVEDFLHLQTFHSELLHKDEHWKSKGHREALDAFAAAIRSPEQKRHEDPDGFLANSRLVLELAEGMRCKTLM